MYNFFDSKIKTEQLSTNKTEQRSMNKQNRASIYENVRTKSRCFQHTIRRGAEVVDMFEEAKRRLLTQEEGIGIPKSHV
jgi:hypothetical protein